MFPNTPPPTPALRGAARIVELPNEQSFLSIERHPFIQEHDTTTHFRIFEWAPVDTGMQADECANDGQRKEDSGLHANYAEHIFWNDEYASRGEANNGVLGSYNMVAGTAPHFFEESMGRGEHASARNGETRSQTADGADTAEHPRGAGVTGRSPSWDTPLLEGGILFCEPEDVADQAPASIGGHCGYPNKDLTKKSSEEGDILEMLKGFGDVDISSVAGWEADHVGLTVIDPSPVHGQTSLPEEAESRLKLVKP